MTRVIDKGKAYGFLPIFERGPRGDTTDRVEKVLRAAIVGLQFEPGEFIDKALICGRLGVSRFPVSEALGRLAAEGLVEILPQRGTRAALIRLPEVIEAMLIRRALEAAVAENAARRLPDQVLASLHRNLAEQEAAVSQGDRTGFYALDLAFHEMLVEGLGLMRVGAVIEASRASIDRVRRLLSSPRRHAVTLAEHRVLVAAIEQRDPRAARAAMEAHLDAVMEEMERFSVKHPDVFART
jgi:DNA-binding GntR family transcriptional regulator